MTYPTKREKRNGLSGLLGLFHDITILPYQTKNVPLSFITFIHFTYLFLQTFTMENVRKRGKVKLRDCVSF